MYRLLARRAEPNAVEVLIASTPTNRVDDNYFARLKYYNLIVGADHISVYVRARRL